MVPKIYYLIENNGKLTSKVKGVSSATTDISYSDLMNIFLKGEGLTFTKKIFFKSLPLGQGSSFTIQEDLINTYLLKKAEGKLI